MQSMERKDEIMYITEIGHEICSPKKSKETKEIWIRDCSIIHFILKGEGYINGKKLHAGQGFIIVEDESFCYYPDSANPWTYAWVNLKDAQYTLLNFNLLHDDRCFDFDSNEVLDRLVEKYYSTTLNITDNQLYWQGVVYMLLSAIHPHGCTPAVSAEESYVTSAVNYVNNFYYKMAHVQEIADHLHISRAYLRNIFVKHTGQSPQSYLINHRIIRAQELLKHDIPISTIAQSVGYDDQLQFSKIFKKHTGLSPSEWRRSKNIGLLKNGLQQ